MRPIGFSTGSLALNRFMEGLDILRRKHINVVELSAMREAELPPLLEALDSIDLSSFTYVSLHAPSAITQNAEENVVGQLRTAITRHLPVIVHPDTIQDATLWRPFREFVVIENMDKRKPTGRSADELGGIFDQLPEASLCFDIAHAHQFDSTLSEAELILRKFGHRLRQVHISEVVTESKHERLSWSSVLAYQTVSHLIPEKVPIVIESRVTSEEIDGETLAVEKALPIEVEGSLHVVRNSPDRYLVMFASYARQGGALPARAFSGWDQLRNFFIYEIEVEPDLLSKAQNSLNLTKTAFLPNIRLTSTKLRELALV